MLRRILFSLLLIGLFCGGFVSAQSAFDEDSTWGVNNITPPRTSDRYRAPQKIAPMEKRYIDLVFAIDVSGSMNNIIAATQKKIWAIVNQMTNARPRPDLRIGLIAYRGEKEECYGTTGFHVWDLSDDLDKIYENLMGLTTGGGSTECVGRAIYEATHSMNWDNSPQTLKILFVLGNEGANQDSDQLNYGYKTVSQGAIRNNININTVYCRGGGTPTPEWAEIARLADGAYTTIGLEGKVVQIITPMDKPLEQLNHKLNDTYVYYGHSGRKNKARQESMDAKASAVGGSSTMADRTMAKSGPGYKSDSWDLVDAMKNENFKLALIEKEKLSEEMQKMTDEERKAHIEKNAQERIQIQKKIKELAEKRTEYIQTEMKKQKMTGDEFDQVILKTLRKQAENKGYKFEGK